MAATKNARQELDKLIASTKGEDMTLAEKIVLLDKKVDAYNETQDPSTFSQQDMRALYGRLASAAQKAKPEVKKMWGEVAGLPGRSANKEVKKKMILFAWLKDPEFKDTFFNMTQSLTSRQTIAMDQQWMCKKQVFDRYGGPLKLLCKTTAAQ